MEKSQPRAASQEPGHLEVNKNENELPDGLRSVLRPENELVYLRMHLRLYSMRSTRGGQEFS